MDRITNAFSLLQLDAEDDRDPAAHLQDTKHDNKGKGAHGSAGPLNGTSSKTDNEDQKQYGENLTLPLAWIDLEMTGLDVENDRILEIACIMTNGSLSKSIEGPDLVIHQSQACLDKMGEWCQTHHGASGLTKRVLQSKITEEEAEKQVIKFVKEHSGEYTPLLAGNSVYVDLLFLKKYMPKLASMFPHVLVDVSSIKALCVRWFPRDNKKKPNKENKHRAMDDIKESIAELKYYKENIFKQAKRK
uniref:Exonuclease domain-containing protein n=1 Tax=Kalanchoe fedtschenkoi TaxID=63787 RepID=A0A7N0VNC6_KALFE